MLAKELISDIVPFLRKSDTGQKALTWMEIFRISHLPIVHNDEFIGLVSDTDIYDLNMVEESIGNYHLSAMRPFVKGNQHIYEVIEIVSRLKLTLVPVLGEADNYLGVITLYDLLQKFASLTAVQNPGGIIVLEMNLYDFSLTQIAHIIEGNDAKLLSLYVDSPKDTTRIEVTIKLNRIDISAVIETFERYGYDIKATYLGENTQESIYQNRYELLLNYLNM